MANEWKRGKEYAMKTLKASTSTLPVSMIIYQDDENGDSIVLGHCKLSRIPNNFQSCLLESIVIHPDYRNRGIGSTFLKEVEEYCSLYLYQKFVYVTTNDYALFFAKNGYDLCKPIHLYGPDCGKVMRNCSTNKKFLKKSLDDWVINKESSEDRSSSEYSEMIRQRKASMTNVGI